MATRDSIITKVREKLDEITPFENSIVEDTDLIETSLDEAAIKLLQIVPLNTIRGYKWNQTLYPPVVDADDDYVMLLPLPSDFLRVHTIKMIGWSRAIQKAYADDSPMAVLQSNTVTRGGLTKPVAILTYLDESSTSDSVGGYYNGYLRLYTSIDFTDAPTAEKFKLCSYVKRLLPEQLRDNLIDPLAWLCAGDIYTIMGNQEQAGVCYQHVQKFIKDNTLR